MPESRIFAEILHRPRVETHSHPVAYERSEAQSGHEVVGVLVVSSCDAPEILEAAKHALNDIASAITPSREGMRLFAIDLVRDHGSDAPAFQPSPPMVRVIGFVGEEISRGRQVLGEHDRALNVGGLPRCQVEGERAAARVA